LDTFQPTPFPGVFNQGMGIIKFSNHHGPNTDLMLSVMLVLYVQFPLLNSYVVVSNAARNNCHMNIPNEPVALKKHR
jgi:hypothetical protein